MTAALAPPAPRRRRPTVLGVSLIALWLIIGIATAWYLYANTSERQVAQYGGRLVSGILTTLLIVASSVTIGAVLSLPIAMGRLSGGIGGWLAFAYSYAFRGTPLLGQTYLAYYGSGQFFGLWDAIGLRWFFNSPLLVVILTFSLNTAAYQAEILAGALRTVPRGQREAAKALGLGARVTLRKVLLPQAFITALRPYGNEIILMVKGSAIASIVTVFDLMGEAGFINSRTYTVAVYVWAALAYLVIVEVLRRIWDVLERRLTRHLQR